MLRAAVAEELARGCVPPDVNRPTTNVMQASYVVMHESLVILREYGFTQV